MFERFDDGARRVVVLAQEEARLLQHHYIGSEHILLGVLHEGDGVAAHALEAEGVSLPAARGQTERLVLRRPQSPAGHIPFTPRAKRVLEASLREARQLGHHDIGTEDILLGILRVDDSVAVQVLAGLGVDLGRLRRKVMDLAARRSPEPGRVQFVSGPTNVARGHCALCGRDLWEVDRYISGITAAVCDACIAAAQRALEDAAATDNRDVPMPPRVFGPAPSDPAEAREIERVFRTIFGGPIGLTPDPGANIALIEDGETLAPLIALAGERHANLTITGARVTRIRFLGPDKADVQYSIHLDQTSLPFEGTAVRRDGRWCISRETMARHLTQEGISVPPPD